MKNFKYSTTELFKVKSGLSTEIKIEIFIFQDNETSNLKSGNHLAQKNIQTTQYGTESISNLGA